MSSQVIVVGLAGCTALLLFVALKSYSRFQNTFFRKPINNSRFTNDGKSVTTSDEDGAAVFEARNLTPLSDFDWKTTSPQNLRPFKPKYHITMGLTNLAPSSLLLFDSTYLERLTLRTHLLATHPDITHLASPAIIPAINELYTYFVTTYLPTVYPTIFRLCPPSPSTPPTLLNQATTTHLPLTPPTDPLQTLKLLGENIDEDFLFLLPDELLINGNGNGNGEKRQKGEYRLQGFVTCFPSGFNTAEKFGKTLREIHGPVPGYKEKLEMSMDRFFDRVEVGKVVKRENWAITTTSNLFSPGGTHLYAGQNPEDEEKFDINNTYLRTERQTLHRLPKSKALVFAFKTYLYPLSQIRSEGNGPALADAIDGLKSGSVPGMWFYKRGVVWGEGVKRFLRDEGEKEEK